ncbi:MAG: amidohydrolase family protein, partial [Gemmatimonadaceae bacterium]
MNTRLIALALAFVSLPSLESEAQGAPAAQPADLIITNARIYTVDPNRPVVEAMAVRGGRVIITGPARSVMSLKGASTNVVDAGGKTVIPGMIDAHVHLEGLGQAVRTADLRGTSSYDEVIARTVAWAKSVPAGAWVFGRAWDQNDWADTRFPTHDKLSAAIADRPTVLERVDGHALLVNAAAMKAAGVTAATKDPSGGKVLRDATGAPTGIFVDNAMGLIARAFPPTTKEELRARTLAATAELNRFGVTSVHDAGVDGATIDVFEEVAREGKFSVRNYVMIAGDDSTIAHYLRRGPQIGLYDGRIWIRAIKL